MPPLFSSARQSTKRNDKDNKKYEICDMEWGIDDDEHIFFGNITFAHVRVSRIRTSNYRFINYDVILVEWNFELSFLVYGLPPSE